MWIQEEHNGPSRHISTKIDFKELMKECFQLVEENFAIDKPNIKILAQEFRESDLRALEIRDIALLFGREKKIQFIKAVRERFPTMDLLTAKMVQEGFWRRLGYER